MGVVLPGVSGNNNVNSLIRFTTALFFTSKCNSFLSKLAKTSEFLILSSLLLNVVSEGPSPSVEHPTVL